jgi:hypothetical protein
MLLKWKRGLHRSAEQCRPESQGRQNPFPPDFCGRMGARKIIRFAPSDQRWRHPNKTNFVFHNLALRGHRILLHLTEMNWVHIISFQFSMKFPTGRQGRDVMLLLNIHAAEVRIRAEDVEFVWFRHKNGRKRDYGARNKQRIPLKIIKMGQQKIRQMKTWSKSEGERRL